jgi:hypothetical protein
MANRNALIEARRPQDPEGYAAMAGPVGDPDAQQAFGNFLMSPVTVPYNAMLNALTMDPSGFNAAGQPGQDYMDTMTRNAFDVGTPLYMGSAIPRPANSVGMFGGWLGKTRAQKAAEAAAKEAEEAAAKKASDLKRFVRARLQGDDYVHDKGFRSLQEYDFEPEELAVEIARQQALNKAILEARGKVPLGVEPPNDPKFMTMTDRDAVLLRQSEVNKANALARIPPPASQATATRAGGGQKWWQKERRDRTWVQDAVPGPLDARQQQPAGGAKPFGETPATAQPVQQPARPPSQSSRSGNTAQKTSKTSKEPTLSQKDSIKNALYKAWEKRGNSSSTMTVDDLRKQGLKVKLSDEQIVNYVNTVIKLSEKTGHASGKDQVAALKAMRKAGAKFALPAAVGGAAATQDFDALLSEYQGAVRDMDGDGDIDADDARLMGLIQ